MIIMEGKNKITQFTNERYYTNWCLGKNSMKKEKSKAFVLFENNQQIVKSKNTDRIPFAKT